MKDLDSKVVFSKFYTTFNKNVVSRHERTNFLKNVCKKAQRKLKMFQHEWLLILIVFTNNVTNKENPLRISKEKYENILRLRSHNNKKDGKVEKVYLRKPLTISAFIGGRHNLDNEYFTKEYVADTTPNSVPSALFTVDEREFKPEVDNPNQSKTNEDKFEAAMLNSNTDEINPLNLITDTSKVGKNSVTPAHLTRIAVNSSIIKTSETTLNHAAAAPPPQPIISEAIPIPNYTDNDDSDSYTTSSMAETTVSVKATSKPLTTSLRAPSNHDEMQINFTQTMPHNKTIPLYYMNQTSQLQSLTSRSNLSECKSPKHQMLMNNLQKNVLETWDYKDFLKSSRDLLLDQGFINRAKVTVGTGRRLRHLFAKALYGDNIHVAAITNSISPAFLQDVSSKKWIYPNALKEWWGKTITPVSGSQILLKDVSIANVGADYFARCLSAHLPEVGEYNLILYEVSGNEYKSSATLKPIDALSLEQFLRTALQYKSNPEVLILNFLNGDHLSKSSYCKELDEEREAEMVSHYDCTALSWSRSICPYLKDDEEGFSFSYLFTRDRVHPSVIGHAQMAYILIDYIRDEFLKFLQEPKLTGRSDAQTSLPSGILTSIDKAFCHSKLKSFGDSPDAENSNLPVVFIAPESYENATHRSKITGYQNKLSIKPIIARFTLPGSHTVKVNHTIGVMSYFSRPLQTMIRVDNKPFVKLKLTNANRGKIIELDEPVELSGGDHLIRFWSLDKTFQVLSLTLDE